MNAAIIPARGGSKEVPRKNLLNFCGRPLLAWSILQARAAEMVDQVYVSSDDIEILNVSYQFGAIPIKRPDELATDTATSESALLHALSEITKAAGKEPELMIFMQATSPLREPADIDGAIRKLLDTKADSLFSMAILDDFCIWTRGEGHLKGLSFDPLNRGRRQDREPLFLENGSIYVFRPEVLRKCNSRVGGKVEMFEMAFWKSFEIDKAEDMDVCSYFFKTRLLPKLDSANKIEEIPATEINLLVYDFDGVMTDNTVLVLQNGTEAITATRADGLGVDLLRVLNKPQIILSTETNPVVQARADKLGLPVISGCRDKKEALLSYCLLNGFDLNKVVYVGNDVNDLEVMKVVGFPVAPKDAHPAIKSIARLITNAEGGQGVIRELADRILS